MEKPEESTSFIYEAKKNYILKITSELEYANKAPKTYWFILICFPYNTKIPAIPPLLADSNFISDFCKKANLLKNSFLFIYTLMKIIADYILLYIKQTPEFIAFVLRKRIHYQ